MLPKNIFTSPVLVGVCEVNVGLIISNWHKDARIEKRINPKTKFSEYFLIEQVKNEIKMKVRISIEDAITIIEKLKLSAKESNSNTIVYK